MTSLRFGPRSPGANGFHYPPLGLDGARSTPLLDERFLAPPGFVWGSFPTADGAVLRWGHLAAESPRAECVLVGVFGDFI
jgi:hypothetical protein